MSETMVAEVSNLSSDDLANELLLACKAARTAFSDLNGRIPRKVWNELFEVTQTLDTALEKARSSGHAAG
jgi:hypothetical protein